MRVVSLALLILLFIPTKYHQNMSKGIKDGGHKDASMDSCFRVDNYTTKKVRDVFLAHTMPTGPPLHLYQILSNYLKQYKSYGLHRISGSGGLISK